jgi:DNA modification methylase
MVADREKLGELWSNLVREFKKNPLNFNFKHVVLTHLGERRSDAYTHSIHSYPAKMFPYIPTFFFSIPELCPPHGVVLDSFCGSGTVLLESLVHPLYKRNVYGIEINPLGRLIAKVKTTPLKERKLEERISHLLELVRKFENIKVPLPESKKIEFWFSKRAICELSKLKYLIEEEGRDDDYKDFFWVCFSSIIRKVSRADPFIPPPVLLKIHKYENSPSKREFLLKFSKQTQNPDVIGLFKSTVEKNFERIRSLNRIKEVREGKIKAHLIWDDARHTKLGRLGKKGELIKKSARTLSSNSIDLLLTSPPYLTAQKYIRTQNLELLWLGMVSENEIPSLEKEVIGSEHVSMKEINFADGVGVKSVDALIKWASSKSPQRAAMVFKYFFEMKKAILEIYRILKDGAYAIIVVGNNKVLGRHVETYKLLMDVAVLSGFKLELVLKDKIRGRGMITRRHNTGGLIKEEFIIVLKKEE